MDSNRRIALSERAHQWVIRQAALAGQDPGAWLDAYILGRLRDLSVRASRSVIGA